MVLYEVFSDFSLILFRYIILHEVINKFYQSHRYRF